MISRRSILKTMSMGAASSVLPHGVTANAASGPLFGTPTKGPKRIIFFLQHYGIAEGFVTPKEAEHGARLTDAALESCTLKPLAPYADRVNIIHGLHGYHIQPNHGSFYGALGGYRAVSENPPAATIDAVIRNHLPEAIVPQVSVGFDSMASMQNLPVARCLTATGPGKPEPLVKNPVVLYKSLFGVVDKETRAGFNETIRIWEFIEREASTKLSELSSAEQVRREPHVAGCRYLANLRKKLSTMGDHLAGFAPKYDARFTDPKNNLDWHDALLDTAMGALRSGVTNVLQIAPGCGSVSTGDYRWLGFKNLGHSLGHQCMRGWFGAVHVHNFERIAKMVKDLESTPEPDGQGTMMDNTLIIYMSDTANDSHSTGNNWPLVTIGNFGGKLNTGEYYDLPKNKIPINSFYNTLLHAVGVKQDYFNMSDVIIKKYDAKPGPIEELLA